MMVEDNTGQYGTAFTVGIETTHGVLCELMNPEGNMTKGKTDNFQTLTSAT